MITTKSLIRDENHHASDVIKYAVLNRLAYVPILSKYIFLDADAILGRLVKIGMVEYIQNLPPCQRRLLHFSLGMGLRNSFMLWHPNNPYTMLKLAKVDEDQRTSSPYHPDNLSWSITSRLIVASTVAPVASKISVGFDSLEHLMYSLMARVDDSKATLDGIRDTMAALIEQDRWELIDTVFADCALYKPSPVKLDVLLESMTNHNTKITPVNYLRVAQRAVNYGVNIPH